MMKEIRKTTQFKKDFKRISKDIKKVEALLEIVRMLAEGKVLPKENKPHPLGGDYINHMECHIGDDYLLIWYDKEKDIIKLVRLGSHSELFGNNRKRSQVGTTNNIIVVVAQNSASCDAVLTKKEE